MLGDWGTVNCCHPFNRSLPRRVTESASHRYFLLDFTTSRLESILFGAAPGHERQYSSSGVPSTGLLDELDDVSLIIEL